MHEVSQAWKDMHLRQLLNESYIDLSFSVTDPDAADDVEASDDGHIYLSDTERITIEEYRQAPKYATLERDFWRADGSLVIPPLTADKYAGYIGNVLSGDDGSFSPAPVITLSFDKLYDSVLPGMTITWSTLYGEYATDFMITAYGSSGEVARETVTGNTDVRSVVVMDVTGYNRIELTVLSWSKPGHYPRMERLRIGLSVQYGKGDIMSYDHSQEISPISASLPVASISFALNNIDDKFDPNNQTGMSKYLMERQRITARYGLKLADGSVEYIPAGTYFLSEWNAPQNGLEATFTARNTLDFLQDTYVRGTYDPAGVTLYDLAVDVLNTADMPLLQDGSPMWQIDESLKDMTTTAPLPLCTQAEALQYIAQAAGCVIYCDRECILHIGAAAQNTTDYEITNMVLYEHPELTLQKPLKAVAVKLHEYYPDETGKELFNGIVPVDGERTVTLTYSDLATDASAAVTGGTLVSAEYYSGACVLTLSGSGDVSIVVTGTTLKDSASDYMVFNADEGDVQTVDNPIITSTTRAAAVGEWARAWLSQRRQISVGSFRADTRLEVMDVISVSNKYGRENVCVTSIDWSYSGAFRGKVEGRVV